MIEFYIVNSTDKPEARLVTVKTDKGLRYVNPEIHARMERYFGLECATNIEDFGITVTRQGQRNFLCEYNGNSVATYPDGQTRHWQGEIAFMLTLPENFDECSD